jgi:hypothetical protein
MSGADIEMLVDSGKRFFVLHGPSEREGENNTERPDVSRTARGPLILEALRRQATLNARLFTPHQAKLLTGPVNALDEALEQVGLKQAERGSVLGLSQSAVSRRKKRGEEGEVQKDINADA